MRIFFYPLLLVTFCLSAQVCMDYYLPTDVTYNSEIPTPEDVLGYVPEEWHVSHDQLVSYARVIAASSDRMKIENYARSYENRQLLHVVVTSPSNHNRLNEIIESRKSIKKGESGETKLVVQLGYSVHGNEPSGANASLLTLYYLAAAQGVKIDNMLDQTVILLT